MEKGAGGWSGLSETSFWWTAQHALSKPQTPPSCTTETLTPPPWPGFQDGTMSKCPSTAGPCARHTVGAPLMLRDVSVVRMGEDRCWQRPWPFTGILINSPAHGVVPSLSTGAQLVNKAASGSSPALPSRSPCASLSPASVLKGWPSHRLQFGQPLPTVTSAGKEGRCSGRSGRQE